MLIKIHIYLVLMLAYMYAIGKLDVFICMYIFVLMHELAHIIIAILLNVNVEEIILLPIGVNAKYGIQISTEKELLISLAGPLASFLFALILQNQNFEIMNISIGIFNLIPIYPFDGGKIIRNILMILLGDNKGRKINYIANKIFVSILLLFSIISIAYLKNYYLLILAIYIFYIAMDELRKEQFYGIINYLQNPQ